MLSGSIGYFWHLKFFWERYERLEMYREDVIIPLGFSSMIVQALLYAWIYPRLFDTSVDESLASALGFGAALAPLAWRGAT